MGGGYTLVELLILEHIDDFNKKKILLFSLFPLIACRTQNKLFQDEEHPPIPPRILANLCNSTQLFDGTFFWDLSFGRLLRIIIVIKGKAELLASASYLPPLVGS
jgi:hypothetical protein